MISLFVSELILPSKDSDVLVSHEVADLDPLEDKSCRWAEGKEKGPEDSRTPRVLGDRSRLREWCAVSPLATLGPRGGASMSGMRGAVHALR